MKKKFKKHIIASIASFACVIHCIITPLVILITPILGNVFTNSIVEISLLIISIGLGIYTIYFGYCRHRKKHTFTLFLMGTLFWICHYVFEHYDISGELAMLGLGTCFVLISYRINHHYLKCCSTCSH
jgi:hypothetical protein